MNSDSFNKQLKSLFDTNHLQLIQSTYFGPRGPIQSTIQKSPLHRALVDCIPPKDNQRQSLDVYIMKQALAKYTVNFINLWDNPKRLNSLLNCLLRVLLNIHLAPIRETKLKDFVQKKKLEREEKLKCNKDLTMSDYPRIQKENISVIFMSRNNRRSLFKNEIKRREKYIKKSKKDYANASKWLQRAERCNERIKTYSEVLKEKEDDDSEEFGLEISSQHNPVSTNYLLLLEDERPVKNTDVSRSRLNTLQAILRNLIYKYDGKSFSKNKIQDVSNDINEKEINVCKLIIDLIQPYFPEKKNKYSIAFQIPFVLMAHQVFNSIGHSKKSLRICPFTSPGHLNALPMDASAIFSLFCGSNTGDGTKKLDIYGFDGNAFLLRQQASEQKDAVFSSFFDLPEIANTAYSYNQKFNHVITFLPGLKTVRVSGTLIRNTPSNSCKQSYTEQLSISARRDINDRIALLKTESNALGLQLKNAIQTRNNHIITSDIKATKSRIYNLQKQLSISEY
ncbi:hypothetical protein MFLAVUS_001461, partial [Mucor flavus]